MQDESLNMRLQQARPRKRETWRPNLDRIGSSMGAP